MARTPSSLTKVTRAKPETTSVRTTIPVHVANKLNVDAGDTLRWDIDKKDDTWIAVFSKEP